VSARAPCQDDGELLAPLLEPHLPDDLRVDDGRSDRLRLGAAAVAAGAGRGVRLCVEEDVLHRSPAARGAGELREDRQPDRQPEHRNQGQRE
jgi:hypothetical protein